MRKILHIDMDAFYASVEQRDNPDLLNRPVVVNDPKGWGVIAAASYQARALGVRAGTSIVQACTDHPQLVRVEARLETYRIVSQQILAIFDEYASLVEPIQLDEAFLDVTDTAKATSATEIAQRIRARIKSDTRLTASAGVSYNKSLAKLASDRIKPDGILVISPVRAMAFLETVKIEELWGVGKATAKKMHTLGIETCHDLSLVPLEWLVSEFGQRGAHFHSLARGVDNRPVRPKETPKSFSLERSFKKPLREDGEILQEINLAVEEVRRKCRDENPHHQGSFFRFRDAYSKANL